MCYFKPMSKSSAPAPQWQDLPSRPKWVPAVGAVCSGVLRLDRKIPKSIFKAELLSLFFGVVGTYLISDYFKGFTVPPFALTMISLGAIWMVSLLVIIGGRIWLVSRSQKFLSSEIYDQDDQVDLGDGYHEIHYLLSQKQEFVGKVARWAIANDRSLQKRHLYALRSDFGFYHHTNYRLTVGDMILKGEYINPEFGLEDVLEGELWREMDALMLGENTVSASKAQSAINRI